MGIETGFEFADSRIPNEGCQSDSDQDLSSFRNLNHLKGRSKNDRQKIPISGFEIANLQG